MCVLGNWQKLVTICFDRKNTRFEFFELCSHWQNWREIMKRNFLLFDRTRSLSLFAWSTWSTRGGTICSNRGPAPRTWGGYAQKGRDRWFQQRPRSNDHGAASHCAICLQRHRGPNNFLQAGLYFLLPFGVDVFEPSGVAKIWQRHRGPKRLPKNHYSKMV